MSEKKGADHGVENCEDTKILDKTEFDNSTGSIAVTLISEDHPSNNIQNKPFDTKEAVSVKPTNVKLAGSDVKEFTDAIPLQNKGAIARSKEKKGMDYSPYCKVSSHRIMGRDGRIKEFTSSETGIIEFKIHGVLQEVTFHKTALLNSAKGKKRSLEDISKIGKLVHFNADILSCTCSQDVDINVTDVWFDKKVKNKKGSITVPLIYYELPENLHHGPVYKATVTEIPNPYKFLAQVDNSKCQVIVHNNRFSPSSREPPLNDRDRISHYISIGDQVSLIVEKYTDFSSHNWIATEAWLEDEDIELNIRCKKKGKNPVEDPKTTENVLEGDVYTVDDAWGLMQCKNQNLIIIFHRENLRLFGVPTEGIHLKHFQLVGETLNCVLEEDSGTSQTPVAKRAWLGSWEFKGTQWDIILHSMQLVEFCREKNLDQQIKLHMAERIASLRAAVKNAEEKDHNGSQVEKDKLPTRINDKKTYSIPNIESSTEDRCKERSSHEVCVSMQDEELTIADIQILSYGIRGIVESNLASVVQKLNTDGISIDIRKVVCRILKNELNNIIDGDFIEKMFDINDSYMPQNAALNASRVADASCQTVSTGPVIYWAITPDF